MSTNRTVTELDFDAIKTDLINYIKSNPAFTDYNFEGSALNSIIDILSYNTHNNAYYANMVHNEGFIDTAQKRSSVVSKSKELGYTPRSAACSTAYVNIVANGVPTGTLPFLLPRGASFRSTNDIASYNFLVVDDTISIIDNGQYKFNQVRIVSGVQTQNYFKVDTTSNVRSIFTIPNKNIDSTTLKVFVRESISSIERVEYFLAQNVYELKSDSRKFFIQESYNGFFQIYFGGDVIGKQPINGNIIDIDYFIVDNYSNPDSCKTFISSNNIGLSTSLSVTTTQAAFGGSDKETIDSIKYNALKSNSAKERAVTVNDYEITLKERFNFIKSVSVWGGENNIPPVYGKVFLSMQPVSGYIISDSVKNDVIAPAIRSASMITISPVFVDPVYTSLEFITRIKFNPNRTLSTQANVETNIKNIVSNYVGTISQFNTDYLESYLASQVLNSDPGIVSVDIDKRVGFKVSPLIGVESYHSHYLNNSIIKGTISSSKFISYVDGAVTVNIKEISGKISTKISSSGITEYIQYIGLYDSNNILVKEIGTANLTTGQFELTFNVYSYITDIRYVVLRAELVSDDLIVLRNQILALESDVIDPIINLNSNNEVVTELYGK